MKLILVLVIVIAMASLPETSAGIVDIKAIAPEVVLLSGNKNRGNGLWKNEVGGNQETRERLETTLNGVGEGGGGGGGGGGLLGGLL